MDSKMHNDSVKKIEYKIAKYKEYWSKGLYFDASIYLGEIFYWHEANINLKNKFDEILETVPITNDILNKIKIEVKKEEEKLQNILSIPNAYVYEEIVLIFTNRISLFLVTSFFKKKFGIDIKLNLIIDIDDTICALNKHKKNKNAFKQGLDRIKTCYNYSPELVDFLNNFSKCN